MSDKVNSIDKELFE